MNGNIKNKIISIFLICLITVSGITPCFAHETSANKDQVLKLLGELEIMEGDPDGNMRLGDTVTRAEFAKAAVASSDYRHSVASGLSVSPFYDVPHNHWAAPYIRVAVTNNIVSGYPDGSFAPDSPVAFEEGITMMLGVLGYTDADFGISWPDGQIGMARSLDMLDNVENTDTGTYMNRGDVATLIYNTLRCSVKNSGAELISLFDVAFSENVTLISTSREDSAIPGDEVFTDGGSFKIREDFDYSQIGMKGDLALKDGRTVIGFFPDRDTSPDEKYVVYTMLGSDVVTYRDGDFEILDIPDGAAAYDGTQRSTYGAVKSTLEMGDVINVRRTGGDVDYVLFNKGGMKGPYTVTEDSGYLGELGITESTKISRGGKGASLSDLKSNDILYYVPELNMAFVYTNKVTGIYEKASPNIDAPTEVTVSGVAYKIEGANALKKLSSAGGAEYGQTVTLLLGKNNDAADVLTTGGAQEAPRTITGYAYDTGTKTYTTGDLKNYSSYYIGVVAPGGETYEYTCDRDCSDYRNSVVTVSFNEGTASVRRAEKPGGVGGIFRYDGSRATFGGDKVSSDIKILDVGTTDKDRAPLYCSVYPERLDNVNIGGSRILYVSKNGLGEVEELILEDVTGDSYTYGLVTSAENVSMGPVLNGSYSYLVNGTRYMTSTNNTIFTVGRDMGVRMNSPQNPTSMSNLTELEGKIEILSGGSLSCNGKTYEIPADVQVYEKPYSLSDEYTMIPSEDLVGDTSRTLYVYYDKPPENGGKIRIILAVKN